MPTAKKRGNTWRCQIYADGSRKSFTAKTKEEAEFLASEWKIKKDKKKKLE